MAQDQREIDESDTLRYEIAMRGYVVYGNQSGWLRKTWKVSATTFQGEGRVEAAASTLVEALRRLKSRLPAPTEG